MHKLYRRPRKHSILKHRMRYSAEKVQEAALSLEFHFEVESALADIFQL